MNQFAINAAARTKQACQSLLNAADYDAVLSFYSNQSQYSPTPLIRLKHLARHLNVGEILVKDESRRFGLPAFKLLGVQYAVWRESGRLPGNPMLVCATDGNHGRAVAHVARTCGCAARIYVPGYTVPARIAAIRGEGAEVVVVDTGYDDAVEEAARFAENQRAVVVSDTSWPGYEEIPRWIMAGYTQIMNEVQQQCGSQGLPDVVFVQVGVGGLAGAVVSWLCHYHGQERPFSVCCEPTGAACLLESSRAGRPVQLKGDLPTIMAGLRCGQVSMIAWPGLSSAVDAFVAIDDWFAESAMRLLAMPAESDPAIVAGESGACGLGSLLAILQDHELVPVRAAARLGSTSRVLVINTEGATDPEVYERVVRLSSR
jgi:diaminopropionate ammonia-lyase